MELAQCCHILDNRHIPLVSGINNSAQNPIATIKAPKNMYVPYPKEVIMYGVVLETRKLQNHWSAVVMAVQSIRISIPISVGQDSVFAWHVCSSYQLGRFHCSTPT